MQECEHELHDGAHQSGRVVQRLDLVDRITVNLALPVEGLKKEGEGTTVMNTYDCHFPSPPTLPIPALVFPPVFSYPPHTCSRLPPCILPPSPYLLSPSPLYSPTLPIPAVYSPPVSSHPSSYCLFPHTSSLVLFMASLVSLSSLSATTNCSRAR